MSDFELHGNNVMFQRRVAHKVDTSPGGARFPSPLCLVREGKAKHALCAQLGFPITEGVEPVKIDEWQKEVDRAVKRCIEKGDLIMVNKFGYTWIIKPSGKYSYTASEVTTDYPGPNVPFGWADL